jgi:hypothetical protein
MANGLRYGHSSIAPCSCNFGIWAKIHRCLQETLTSEIISVQTQEDLNADLQPACQPF